MRIVLILAPWILLGDLQAQQFTWPTRQLAISRTATLSPEDVTQVTAAVRLDDGRIVVADQTAFQVYSYEPGGKRVWTFGRQGGGPGEYRSLSSMVRCRDGTLGTLDRRALRLTTISHAGKLVDTRPMEAGRNGRLMACQGATDAVLQVSGLTGPPEPGLQRMPQLMVRVRGSTPDTIGAGYSEIYVAKSRSLFVSNPLTEFVEMVAGGSVAYLCQRRGGGCLSYDIVSGRRDSFELALPRRRMSTAEWNHQIEEFERPMSGSPEQARLRALYQEIPKPDTWPRLLAIAADDAGRLWAKVDSTRWLVANRTGQPFAIATLPVDIQIMHIGADHLLGLSTDDDGLPHLTVYRMQPRP